MAHAVALIHEENGTFGISFPDFPGCVSTADNLDDVILRGNQALTFHVAGMIEDKEPIPVLRTAAQIKADPEFIEDVRDAAIAVIPVDLPGKSVRINITLDEHLLAAVDKAARSHGSTRSGFLADAARSKIVGA